MGDAHAAGFAAELLCGVFSCPAHPKEQRRPQGTWSCTWGKGIWLPAGAEGAARAGPNRVTLASCRLSKERRWSAFLVDK